MSSFLIKQKKAHDEFQTRTRVEVERIVFAYKLLLYAPAGIIFDAVAR
jgi:hypothetical protein